MRQFVIGSLVGSGKQIELDPFCMSANMHIKNMNMPASYRSLSERNRACPLVIGR